MKIRLSKRRRDFGTEHRNLIDKEAGDNPTDVKPRNMQIALQTQKRVLDMGLQAARKMKTFQSQTYYNRSVNYSCQYDFIQQKPEEEEDEFNMDQFMDNVAVRVEEALQSNELINVFQDDFEMLGDKQERGGKKKVESVSSDPLPFSDIDYSKNKRVSCISFHPTKPYVLALSFVENLSFDDRAEISGKSYMNNCLVLNFEDTTIIQK